jgi:two-component system response regulator GlrR
VDAITMGTNRHRAPPAQGVTLLYVEDNRDLREALAALLGGEGYQVDVADSAGEGLARLRARRFHVVISDYALPDHPGTWMLQRAAEDGLLERTATLIVTACPDLTGAGSTPVLHKPLELDLLLDHLARLVPSRR